MKRLFYSLAQNFAKVCGCLGFLTVNQFSLAATDAFLALPDASARVEVTNALSAALRGEVQRSQETYGNPPFQVFRFRFSDEFVVDVSYDSNTAVVTGIRALGHEVWYDDSIPIPQNAGQTQFINTRRVSDISMSPSLSVTIAITRLEQVNRALQSGQFVPVLPIQLRIESPQGFFISTTVSVYFAAGYGVVGMEAIDANGVVRAKFDPVSLTAAPALNVIEYRNTADFPVSPGGQFFYTTDPAEQAFVDSGGAGKFVRTGKSFKAGGYVRLCRFYGSVKPGPNSHFFTTGDGECKQLQSLQKTPTPTNEPQWNFEGYAFGMNAARSNADGSTTCPTGSIPVYRAYNNAFDARGKNAWDSNHRFSIAKGDIEEMVTKHGWKDEGTQMCAPE